MKLRALAVLIPVLSAVGAVNAAEVYNKDGNKLDLFGQVRGLHYFSDNASQDGDQSYTRIGFKGETQINDQLTGFSEWEYQFQDNRTEGGSDATTGDHTRLGFAGLKYGDYGSLDYGRNNGILYDIAAWTDMQPEFDGSTYRQDQFMYKRTTGVATYRNNNFFGLVDGLKFAIQYQGQNGSPTENANGRDVLRQNGDGYGMSLSYDLGMGISAGGAFFNSKRTDEQNGADGNALISGRGSNAEGYTGGLKYDAGQLYLSAMFTQSYNASAFGSGSSAAYGYANKSQAFEAYANYQFEFGLTPFIGYNQTRAEDLGAARDGNTYNNQDLVKFVDIGATYYFNKNMSTYVDYKINLIDSSQFTRAAAINTDDVVAVALVYQF